MEKNQNFFDPYNFNIQPTMQHMSQPAIPSAYDMPPGEMANPIMYYEQQYMYYNYLCKMLEYKMKMKEWENLNNKEKK